ncbi:hypothetical protein [Tumebacillus flagellatus]|uniref:hypothetical protein n=1 Tax=Tumebacillus flagellatus TaxID=1157490 RepID=UPI00057183C3|nr:hypothetical protein [Tumebacillus flagellatus]
MNGKEELRLARALYQLRIYFESIQIPLTLQELYQLTYGEQWQEMPGALWLNHLDQDAYVTAGLEEFHTLKTILQTMDEAGLGLLLSTLEEETARLGVHVFVPSPGFYANYYRHRSRPRDPDEPES